MAKKYTLILVPETHWDREWYSPFQKFRIQLVRLTDKLLKLLDTNPEYKSFTFDGQTIILEDYLEIRPQEREHIAKYVKEGRLFVGPWYILPDEYLVSAEATVRNLMIGHKISEEFGRTMKAGYVPDPFGHISQLPQILAGFGINSFFFTRGMGDEADAMNSEFWWEAPDGTKILAINQVEGYCNAVHLGKEWVGDGWTQKLDGLIDRVNEMIRKLGNKASTKYLLLNNGCDHVEPQVELPELIKYINERIDDGEIIHSDYEAFTDMILAENPELKTHKGELHSGKYHALLPGVFSARMYIKQANERTQTLLEKWAEPASAFAWLNGRTYDAQILWEAWKLCIKNHPHDSICGCSVDQVHREMMPRFDQSQQIGETMATESLDYLAGKIDTTITDMPDGTRAVIAFNPHAWNVSDTVKIPMERSAPTGELLHRFVIKDENGNVIPTQISDERIVTVNRFSNTWHGNVCFEAANVPSLGYKTYYLEEYVDSAKYKMPSLMNVGTDSIENDFIKIKVHSNGTFDLFDKKTQAQYCNLNLLEDTEDVGDEYNYSYAYNSRTITSEGAQGAISLVEKGPVFATLRADFVMNLPESVMPDRLTRSERAVPCPVSTYITVHANSPRIDITTEFENNAKDHRIRAHFPTGISSDVCFAEGHFDVVERKIELPSAEDWIEKPIGQNPVQSFVAVDGGGNGMAVINQGMPEYEVLQDTPRTIAQTLLRCCGWLSRNDYITRPYDAGPTYETPEAQCLGKHIFKYAVLPYSSNWKEAKVWQYAHQHNAPIRPVLTKIHEGELPKSQSFVQVSSDNLIVTAVKKAEKADALVVRVLNTTPDAVDATITISSEFNSAVLTNMNEEPTDAEAAVQGNSVKFNMPGFRVQTVLFYM